MYINPLTKLGEYSALNRSGVEYEEYKVRIQPERRVFTPEGRGERGSEGYSILSRTDEEYKESIHP